ncbi:Zinc finger C2H2-type [Cinara cedri]|uniref:Zinc finger C2H2-type n=1 Tax=Cinara cedri TaxID=506608 RepID=A0A5E4MB69_9HEMI|nr:Zinc finger C2H2-type [Cinara cedri]
MITDSDSIAEKFECKLCGKVYQWKQSLKRHIREDRCDKGPQHACPRCGMSFKHTSRLNKHVILCPHIVFDDNPANASTSSSSSSPSSVKRIIKLPPPCPDALPITAVPTNTTATSSTSQTILVLHLKNQHNMSQNWNSKIQKLGN